MYIEINNSSAEKISVKLCCYQQGRSEFTIIFVMNKKLDHIIIKFILLNKEIGVK